MRPVLAAMIAMLGLSAPAHAVGEPRRAACEGPDGGVALVEGRGDPARSCHPIDAGLGPVRWVGWLGGGRPAPGERVALEGAMNAGAFAPGSARRVPAGGGAGRGPVLPVGLSLLGDAVPRTFGIEERARVERSGTGLRLRCEAGSAPAGLVLGFSAWRLPSGAPTAWRLDAHGDPGFVAGAAALGAAPAGTVPLPSPAPIPADVPEPTLVVACPSAAARLTLDDLWLERRGAPAPARIERSAWAWRPERWREGSAGLRDELARLRAERVFVSLVVDGGVVRDAAALARFVREARRQGVAVVAVEGDPGMALDPGRAEALRRLKAIAAYQRSAAAEERLAGVQYDIEPYLLPAWSVDPGAVLRGWAATLAALVETAPAPLDAVVPFWLADDAAAAATVLPALARADRVTVMAYRTDARAVQAAARPFLAWGEGAGVPVIVALEAGPVADETVRTYVPTSAAGALHLVPVPDGRIMAVLLQRPAAGAAGRVYAHGWDSVAPGSTVSFLGDAAALEATVAALEPALRQWSSFAGFALHGMID